jgi:hypothetical protein
MQSTQADVRSAVPRTVPMMRNLISVGQADEASSCEYAPQKLIARTPMQVSLYGRRFRRPALSHSLCSQKVGRQWLCSTCLRLFNAERVRTVLS